MTRATILALLLALVPARAWSQRIPLGVDPATRGFEQIAVKDGVTV